MNNPTKIFTLISTLIFSINIMFACSCANVPKTFIKNVQANHIIFSAEILEHIKVPNESNPFMSYHSLTKLKIIKWYQNRMESDTIYYANGQGAACDCSIGSAEIGTELIIKSTKAVFGSYIEFLDDVKKELLTFVNHFKNLPIVGYYICDVSILELRDDFVIGNISKNYEARKGTFERFVRRISKKWAKKLEGKRKNEERKFEKMEIEKFGELMKKKCTTL